MKNNDKIFCVTTETCLVIFIKPYDSKKIKNKYDMKIQYKLDETSNITCGDMLQFFLCADFSTDKTAESTFYSLFKKSVRDKIREFDTLEQMRIFQKKFQDAVDSVFVYEINDKDYDNKLREYMRYSPEESSISNLLGYIDEILINRIVTEENENYLRNVIQYELEYTNDVYIVHSLRVILYLALRQYVSKDNMPIRRCKNCGKFFLPSKRFDELYCNRLVGNTGKTCKQIGSSLAYEAKLTEEPALMLYRNITKRKYMKAQRSRYPTIEHEKYEKWKEKAKKEYAKYKKGTLTAEQFTKWLEENE